MDKHYCDICEKQIERYFTLTLIDSDFHNETERKTLCGSCKNKIMEVIRTDEPQN